MPSTGTIARILSIAVLLTSALAPAQCNLAVSTEFANPELSDPPGRFAVFDDGSGNALYACGSFTAAGGQSANGLARWDGISWTSLPPPPFATTGVSAMSAFDDGTGPALYAAFWVPGSLAAMIQRWNGTSWSGGGGGTPVGIVSAFEVFDPGSGPMLLASSSLGSISVWTGTGWAPFASASGAGGHVYAMRTWNDGSGPALYVAGDFTSIGGVAATGVARFDGVAWAPVGGPVTGPPSTTPWGGTALEPYDDGTGPALYLTGGFTGVAGVPAVGIARWSGASWSAVGAGLGGTGSRLFAWDDGSGPALYVTGSFATAGGIPASGIARYASGAWSALAGGLGAGQPAASALAAYDDGTGPALYAGGYNPAVGTTSARYVARWDGSTWTELRGNGLRAGGFGFPNATALCAADLGDGAALYVGGQFQQAGSAAASGAARWRGASWSALGTGPGAPLGVGTVALAAFDPGSGPRLYAGGYFNTLGGVLTGCLGQWDGTSWTTLGGLTTTSINSPSVSALAVHDDGSGPRLFAGGAFDAAGGIPSYGIAAWDGVSWAAEGAMSGLMPGSVITSLVLADFGSGPELFAAGYNGATWFVARRIGGGWQTLGNADGAIRALAFLNDGSGPGVYVGGQFSSIGGIAASLIARWSGGWTSAAPPITGSVDALAVHDDGSGAALYALGYTTPTTYYSQTSGIAKLQASSWIPILAPLASYNPTFGRPAMLSFDDGSGPALYVVGPFTGIGGVSSSMIGKWGPSRPIVELTQAGGPGSPVHVRNTWLVKSHEYYNVFSDSLCGVVGSGPYLGLCAPNPALLLAQFAMPLGAAPIHFSAPIGTLTSSGFVLPPGLWLDAVCFDYTGGVLGCVSRVTRIQVQ